MDKNNSNSRLHEAASQQVQPWSAAFHKKDLSGMTKRGSKSTSGDQEPPYEFNNYKFNEVSCGDKGLSDKKLQEVSSNLGPDQWPILLVRLDVTVNQIEQEKENHPNDTVWACLKCLCRWRDGVELTEEEKIQALIEGLIYIGRLDLVDVVKG